MCNPVAVKAAEELHAHIKGYLTSVSLSLSLSLSLSRSLAHAHAHTKHMQSERVRCLCVLRVLSLHDLEGEHKAACLHGLHSHPNLAVLLSASRGSLS